MMHKYSKVLAVVALASTVSAQDSTFLDAVSSSCKAALKGLLLAPEAQCLNTGAFLSIAASGNVDVPAIANSWLTGLCSLGSCSSASLASIVNNVTAGCAEDAQTLLRVDISDTALVQSYVAQYYPSVRQIACLKDNSAGTLCVPQTITSIQSITGPLGIDDLIVDNLIAEANKLTVSDYKNIACTSCSKQAYNIAANIFPDPSLLETINGPIADTCGASFIDGQNVTTVAQTAAQGQFAVKTQTGGGEISRPITTAGATLVAVSSMFALLV